MTATGRPIVGDMWVAILLLFTSCLVEVIGLTGYVAVHYYNRSLLVVYIGSLTCMTLLFIGMSFFTFLKAYAINISYVPSVGKQLWTYHIVLGIACLLVIISSLFPLVLSYIYASRLHAEYVYEHMRHLNDGDLDFGDSQHLASSSQQLRVVLKFISTISLCASFVMLIFGAYALSYLEDLRFDSITFAVFGLIYNGVLLFLTSLTGFWSATTKHRIVVLFFYRMAIPVFIGVALFASEMAFQTMSTVMYDLDTADSAKTLMYSGNIDTIKVTLMAHLIVTGMSCTFACMLQVILMITARQLEVKILSQNEKDRFDIFIGHVTPYKALQSRKRSGNVETPVKSVWTRWDKFCILWGAIVGIYSIFYNGSYVIFSTWPASENKNYQWTYAWQQVLLINRPFATKFG